MATHKHEPFGVDTKPTKKRGALRINVNETVSSKVWDEITYAFPNFNGATIEVWEWISNSTSHFIMDLITYPCRE